MFDFIYAKSEHETEQREHGLRWLRWQTSNLMNAGGRLKKPIRDPKQLFLLGSEMEHKPRISKEAARAILDKWSKIPVKNG